MGKKIDLTGHRFGRLVVIREAGRDKHGKVLWLCRCLGKNGDDCGNEVTATTNNLNGGHTKSCGCYALDIRTKHGMYKCRLYRIWHQMLCRGGAKQGADVRTKKDYHDRGITVCEEWLVFENFRDWALANGYSEEKQIDRIDNDKGYCPENCHWVTPKENMNNRRNTLRLEDGTPLAIFCQKVGIQTMTENGKVSKQYDRIMHMYKYSHKPHPELIKRANELIALYTKTLKLLQLLEDARLLRARVQESLPEPRK